MANFDINDYKSKNNFDINDYKSKNEKLISENPSGEKFKYETGMDRTPVDTLRDLIAGSISGLGKGGQTIATSVFGKYAPQVDFDELTSAIASHNKSMGGSFAKGMGEYFPYGIAGGPSLLGQALGGAGAGYALTNPEESNLFGILPKGKLGGAIESSLLNMLTHGTLKGLEALRPSKMFRGNLSPKELEQNLAITEGTETGLGDVIGSPFLKKRLENTLTALPFSGANEALQRSGQQVLSRGENILSDLLGGKEPHNVTEQIANDLGEQFKNREIEKNAHYTKFNELADKENLKLDLPTFSETAKKYANAIESSGLLKNDPDAKSLLNKLQNYQNPVSEIGTLGANALPIMKYPTAKEALLLKGKLNRLANASSVSPDPTERGLSKIFGNLASSLSKDIRSTVSETKNPKLINALNTAEENYSKNYSPFLDKEIYKYISGDKNPETMISNFVKTSPNADLASAITKLGKTLSPQSKELLAYGYLSRALDNEGNLNPSKLSTAIKKLQPNQLKALIPDPLMRNRLKNYTKLESMNKEGQYLMFNPKTGQRLSDAVITGLLGGAANILAGGATTVLGPAAAILGGRALTKILTSPSLRESIVKNMIENKPRINTGAKRKSAEILTQSIANAMNRNE